ncbi:hypothetical protein KAI60_01435 [Candidatus Bathyarchaeota archaeon]|nr:hypothetical protein [Candidatus Bathyarchaeota archaeon]
MAEDVPAVARAHRVNGFFGEMVKLGRITPSFRRLLIAEIERLHKQYRRVLRDPKLQDAFDLLIREWSREDPVDEE